MSRNYARFYILLNRLPTEDKDELKASLVNQYTGGRTESLREMTVNEYDAMCETCSVWMRITRRGKSTGSGYGRNAPRH